MKAMSPPGYHHNGFVATHALGWAHDVLLNMISRTSYAQVYELPQSHCGVNRGTYIVFMIAYIYYAHLASMKFEHSVCIGVSWITYDHFYIYIYILHIYILHIYIYI